MEEVADIALQFDGARDDPELRLKLGRSVIKFRKITKLRIDTQYVVQALVNELKEACSDPTMRQRVYDLAEMRYNPENRRWSSDAASKDIEVEAAKFDGWTKNDPLKMALGRFVIRLRARNQSSTGAASSTLDNLLTDLQRTCSDSTLRSRVYELAGLEGNPEQVKEARARKAAQAAIDSQSSSITSYSAGASHAVVSPHSGTWDPHDDDCLCARFGSFCNRNGYCWSCCGATVEHSHCSAYANTKHSSAVSSGSVASK